MLNLKFSKRLYTSYVHEGYAYEAIVAKKLAQILNINLIQTGKAGDSGIDFKGIWTIQTRNSKIHILGQCKNTKNKIPVKTIRDFEGMLSKYENENVENGVGLNTIGVFVSNNSLTCESADRIATSKFCLLFCRMDGQSNILDFFMNFKAQQLIPEISFVKKNECVYLISNNSYQRL